MRRASTLNRLNPSAPISGRRRRAPKTLPPQAELIALLDYDAATGGFRWKARPVSWFSEGRYSAARSAAIWNGKHAGQLALTTITPAGYRYGSIGKMKVYAHRIAWKLVHGTEPDEIDHIDGNPSNNRIANLRSVTHAENGRNARLPADNSSGVIGVRWNDECGKWAAEIRANGRTEYLGLFRNQADAITARKAAEARLGFHPNHGRKKEHA